MYCLSTNPSHLSNYNEIFQFGILGIFHTGHHDPTYQGNRCHDNKTILIYD